MKKYTIICLILMFTVSACKLSQITFPLNSRDLTKEYQVNKHKADKEYKNRILIVEGRISHVFENKNGNTIIFLGYKRDAYGVQCEMKSGFAIKKPLKQNNLVQIKGFCRGIAKNIIMTDCIILKK